MIKLQNTRYYNAISNSNNKNSFTKLLAQNILETRELSDNMTLCVNVKPGLMRKTPLPIFLDKEDSYNTEGKDIVFLDAAGLSKDELRIRTFNAIMTLGYESSTTQKNFNVVELFTAKAYVTWIGESLVNRLGINYKDGQRVSVLLALYFLQDNVSINDYKKSGQFESVVSKIEQLQLGLTGGELLQFLNTVLMYEDEPFGFEVLVSLIRKISPELEEKVNLNTIVSIVANHFGGSKGGPLVCTAIEYRPTFITLLYTAVTDKGYSKFVLSDVVQKRVMRGRGVQQAEMFVNYINSVYNELT